MNTTPRRLRVTANIASPNTRGRSIEMTGKCAGSGRCGGAGAVKYAFGEPGDDSRRPVEFDCCTVAVG